MRAITAAIVLLTLTACGSLPHDGPTAHSFPKPGGRPSPLYATVDLDYGVIQELATHPPAALTGLADSSGAAPSDLIAEGDVLAVSIFEAASGGLFPRSPDILGADSQQTLPRLVVDPDGNLPLPFAGAVHVAGLRPAGASNAIRLALRGRAIDPQVSVTVVESHANSVSVLGEVKTSGHFPLSPHNDRLLDVLASAGGPTRPPRDLRVVVSRSGRFADAPLNQVLDDPRQNIRLEPQDQIRVLDKPRKYSTFGAFFRDTQTLIEDDDVTLAQAIARAGGLDTNSANAASVVVFRFERPEIARDLGVVAPPTAKGVPIVYRLNLRQPQGVFIADNFDIRPNDLVYVARSDITEAQKFFQLLDSVTQLTYNVTQASNIP
jgi:polysaccharide export outer membrane protein